MTTAGFARSDVSLRILGARDRLLGTTSEDATDSPDNINTNPLPDGALCWVTAEKALFVFDRFATAPPLVVDGINVIAPTAGPGLWVRIMTNTGCQVRSVAQMHGGPTTVPNDGVPHLLDLSIVDEVTGSDLTAQPATDQVLVNTSGWYSIDIKFVSSSAPNESLVVVVSINAVAVLVPTISIGAQNVDAAGDTFLFTLNAGLAFLNAGDLVGVAAVESPSGPAVDVTPTLTVSGPIAN